jgi:hypothetical protein
MILSAAAQTRHHKHHIVVGIKHRRGNRINALHHVAFNHTISLLHDALFLRLKRLPLQVIMRLGLPALSMADHRFRQEAGKHPPCGRAQYGHDGADFGADGYAKFIVQNCTTKGP